ncbi:hypothetical protein CDAR_596971 [Caerostris darwini]|uniref:Uncharacterized protein n=1 Tax=Caerostris darwini TaxID=1538125 RepID=A0AAV4U2C3_9ARAC|nr:hypothetical protein CDAR_596971 [Caerostris darwini]
MYNEYVGIPYENGMHKEYVIIPYENGMYKEYVIIPYENGMCKEYVIIPYENDGWFKDIDVKMILFYSRMKGSWSMVDVRSSVVIAVVSSGVVDIVPSLAESCCSIAVFYEL